MNVAEKIYRSAVPLLFVHSNVLFVMIVARKWNMFVQIALGNWCAALEKRCLGTVSGAVTIYSQVY